MSTTSRRTKWHPTPPPPPSPKILHFPRSRRTRRKQPKSTTLHFHPHHRSNPLLLLNRQYLSSRGNLENLFDQENDELPKASEPHVLLLSSNSEALAVERRERVGEVKEECGEYGGVGSNEFEEEKWMFQAEILRAECNFLRMEREFALKKLERNRVKMERTLRSAVHTLVSGKKNIFEGKNVNAVLEKEIEDLSEKLEELHKSSRIKDNEVRNCSNFDKKACLLQRRLEKLGKISDESCLNELQGLTESSLSIDTSRDNDKHTESKSTEVDELRKKMEGLSKGMLDRVEEEYGSMLSSTANSSVASSASTSKGIECPLFYSFSTRQMYQAKSQTLSLLLEPILHEDNRCSGRCKAIVHRIVEQVRAETEQWSQMQEMLGQVRGEMEELHASRDFWENRAHNSDYEIQSLKHAVEEWKEKAHGYEIKANELQLELSVLREELQKSKAELNLGQNREVKLIPDPPRKQFEKENHVWSYNMKDNQHSDEKVCKFENAKEELNIQQENIERTPAKDLPPISLVKQLAKEKRMLLRRLKEKRHASEKVCIQEEELSLDGRGKPQTNSIGVVAPKRSPLRDIGNSSSLARQNGAVYPFHSPESNFRTRESCRK
ncbi:hypothetical protein Pfo_017777 [Paulownia fortunei]|nr:hypothetical protein Pfo_017777 [Paulownia fortunei]